VDLSTVIVPGRTYILCVREVLYEGQVLRKSDRMIEMSCGGKLIRLDAREVQVVLEPSARGRESVA